MSEHVLSILVKAIGSGKAASDLKGVDAAVGKIGTTAHKAHASLLHFGDRIGSIAATAGLAGIAGGALGIAGALEQGVEKADAMALAVEKLTGVTSLSAHSASQLVAVFEKFGIDTEGAVKIAGFAEKALGKLDAGHVKAGKSAALQALELRKLSIQLAGGKTKAIDLAIAHQKVIDALRAGTKGLTKLDALDKQYGLHLKDATGKVVDFQSELLQVADFYNSSASASAKAAVASTLFGKGYVALIPILKLGSKGIKEAAAEADKLGLTLKTAQDVKNVHDFIAAQREAKDSIAGLEVQIGLLVMPDLTKALGGLSSFIQTHREEIKGFFADGLKVAEGLASFVSGTLIPAAKDVGTAFVGGWNLIPAPLREMIVKGAIADRTIKFLFGFSPIHTVLDIAGTAISKTLGSVLGSIMGKGIVQPVLVTNPGGIGGGGGAPSAPSGGVGTAGKVFLAAESIVAIGAVIATQQSVSAANSNLASGISSSVAKQITGGASLADLRQSLGAVDQGIADIANTPLNVLVAGDALDQLKAQHAALVSAIAVQERGYALMTGTELNTGKIADDTARAANNVRAAGASMVDAVNRQGVATNGIPSAISRLHDATNAVRGKLADDVAATQGVRAAVNAKKLSVSLHTVIPVTNNVAVSGRDIVRQRTTFAQVGHVYAS